MKNGTIIFLNGTSSAGKTTLALALQETLVEPFQHMALDQFRDGMSAKYRGVNAPKGSSGADGLNVVPNRSNSGDCTSIEFGSTGQRMLRGMRRAIAAMALEGNNIIIDDIILHEDFLTDYLIAMSSLPVYFVGVRCPLEAIKKRESLRLGRFPGTAEGHFAICHAHQTYDIEVDTSVDSPEDCAAQVIARISSGPAQAFQILTEQSKYDV